VGTYETPSHAASLSISDMYDSFFGDDAAQSHSRRLMAYRRYWLYYTGKHWSYTRGESDPTLTFNYCRRLVDLHVNFTFKGGFKITIPEDPVTPGPDKKDRDFIRVMLEETWNNNDRDLWLMEAGQSGSVTGDVFARVSWDDTDPLENPYARVDLLPSHFCFPEFCGPHGANKKSIRRILIVNPVYKEPEDIAVSGVYFSRNPKPNTTSSLLLESEEWIAARYDKRTGEMLSPAKVRYYENKEYVGEKVSPIGEIPIVHIPNYPLSGEYYGMSDLADIMDLNRELNEKATDISDIINYHGSPTTIVSGAKLTDLEKGANRVWSVPETAKVYNLELNGDLSAASEHYDKVRSALIELSGTTEQALGNFEGSVPPSGVSLQLQYLPMLDKRDVRVLMFRTGLRLINRLILKTTEIGDPAFGAKMAKVDGNPYRNDVTFAEPLPQDERRELEVTKERLVLGLSNRRRELEKQGVPKNEIDRILEGVKEDMMLDNDAIFSGTDDVGVGSGNFQLDRGGADSTRGEKIVDNDIDNNLEK